MPSRTTAVEACMLSRSDRGEHMTLWQALCPENGLIGCLKRMPSGKPGKLRSAQPCLFDIARLELSRADGAGLWFLKDYQPLRRHDGIGASHKALFCASDFAAILLKTLRGASSAHDEFALCRKAFAAWSERRMPETTLLKCLWTLAREAGYPVKEAWLSGLEDEERGEVGRLLQTPLERIDEADEQSAQNAVHSLKKWLSSHTDIAV